MKLRIKIIEQIEQVINSNYWSVASVCFLMQNIRILIEIDNTKSSYKITSHYCNWLLHKELDRSNSPLIIQNITQSIEESKNKDELLKRISENLSIKSLVSEIKEILWKNITDKRIIVKKDTDESWSNFVLILLNQIVYRPLKLKPKPILLNNYEISIYGVSLIYYNESICVEILSKELKARDKRILLGLGIFK